MPYLIRKCRLPHVFFSVTGSCCIQMSAMVTSTSTPGSMEMDVICFTTSDGECKSIKRLWIRISQQSQVLVPSPFGDLRTVILSLRVGRRTGQQLAVPFHEHPQ